MAKKTKATEPLFTEETQTYTATCVSTVLSPLTHMAGTAGNEAIVMREPVVYRGGLRYVPVLSGNALRHRLLRAPLARHICDTWGLSGKITLDQLQFLFHGGALTQRGGRINLNEQARLFRLFPALRLLGCSLPGQIITGSLYVLRGTLVCRENRARLMALLPEDLAAELPRTRLRPAAHFLGRYQYTRNVARISAADIEVTDGEGTGGAMGLFAGQHVVPGAVFCHGFVLRHCTLLDVGALALGLRLWAAGGSAIGGAAAKGHGRLDLAMRMEPSADLAGAAEAYCEHVQAVRDEGLEYLASLYARAAEEPEEAPEEEPADVA